MRRHLLVACALIAAATAIPTFSAAQSRGGRPNPEEQQQKDAAKKRKQAEEWGDNKAALPALRNAGPCPYVKTLYDAARYVEFKDNREASANVGYAGEIQGLSAGCAYKDEEPIRVAVDILFELGRGPQAGGSAKTYNYWIAVTDRNREVIAKQNFTLPVTFPAGQDRVYLTEHIKEITIPRAEATTSGANFEVLVGFDVTPQMAEFNRLGKRFRVNASGAVASGTAPTKQ